MQIRLASCPVRTSTAVLVFLVASRARGAPAQGRIVLAPDYEGGGSKSAPAADPQTDGGPGFFSEPRIFSQGISLTIDTFGDTSREKKNGPYVAMSNMITGAGWLSGGPG